MVHFTDKQWERLRANYRKWWKNELHRPILPCILQGREPGRLRSEAPLLCFANVNDFSVTAEQLVDRWDYELSCCEFYGDAFPFVPMTRSGHLCRVSRSRVMQR